jgi:hypothetical protein
VVDLIHVCYKFGVRSFGSIQGFNKDDFGYGALDLTGTCTKTSRLSSTTPDRLRYGSGDSSALTARSGDNSGR